MIELATLNWLKIQSSLYGDIENKLFDGDKSNLSPTGDC
jgi:hypothetical protein